MARITVTRILNEEEVVVHNMAKKLNGFFYFSPNLPVRKEVVGKHFAIKIGDNIGHLYLPIFPVSFPGNIDPLQPPLQQIKKAINWGSVEHSSIGNCTINCFFFTIDRQKSKMTFREMTLLIEKWQKVFLENLSLVAGINVRAKAQPIISGPIGEGRFELFYKRKKVHDYTIASMNIQNNDVPYGITISELTEAIEITSRSEKHALEFYLFLDSWEAFLNSDFRKCVVDAGTAVELGLNNALRKYLSISDEYKSILLSKFDSFRSKRDLCKKLDIPLPKLKYDKQFDPIRNKVVHAGYTPKKEEAESVLTITNTLLNSIVIDKFIPM